MSPPESEPGFVVPVPAAAAAAAGGCGQQQRRNSSSKASAIAVGLSSRNGWDVEAEVALLELLHDDVRALCAVSR